MNHSGYCETIYSVRAIHLNAGGRLFGGQLMQWIDEVAGMAAWRYCGCRIVTACVDTLNFKGSAKQGDAVFLQAKVTYVGNTSIEVRVDTYIEKTGGVRKLINTAYIVEVAMDADWNPVKVPQFIPETEDEKTEWENGEKRYQLRKERQQQGF